MSINILERIEQRQAGLTRAIVFKQRVQSHYVSQLALNRLENLEKVHTGASINSIDVDAVENR